MLGSSKQLNVAPEAALSLLLGQAISQIKHDYPEPKEGEPDLVGLGIATVITLQVSPVKLGHVIFAEHLMQVGLISFLLGVFRLGIIDVVLSRALLRGFITAVAVVIMV